MARKRFAFQYRMDDVDPLWLEGRQFSHRGVHQHSGRYAPLSGFAPSKPRWRVGSCRYFFSRCRRKPYLYETGWFRLVFATVCILALTAAYRLRLRQMPCAAKTLGAAPQRDYRAERLLDESAGGRASAPSAGELHDGVLQQITSLSLMLGHLQETTPIRRRRRPRSANCRKN